MTTLWLALACVSWETAPVDLVAATDVFISTGGLGFGQGSGSPAATLPAGLMKIGPDTTGESGALGPLHASGYYYEDPYISAFSLTRKPGIGAPAGGAVGWMPTTAETVDPDTYRATLDHDKESAGPGWYRVELEGVGTVELAAGLRTAHMRFDWEGAERWLTLDLSHTGSDDHGVSDAWVELDTGSRIVRGYALLNGSLTGRSGGEPTYFLAEFSEPWVNHTLWDAGRPQEGVTRLDGANTALTLQFDADVEVRLGLSMIDIGGAEVNLALEHPDGTLEDLAARAEAVWQDTLGTFEVTGGTALEQEIFASALYHAHMMPTAYGDADGLYLAAGGGLGFQAGWTYYTDFSLWDTYRTLHPLVILAWPELAADHARSLTDMGRRLGFLPRWPAGPGESGSMLGNSADIVLAETWLKGVQDFDAAEALEIAVTQATDLDSVRPRDDLSSVLTYGYVPYDLGGSSVSKTLEYAIDDHALALWAADLGEDELATEFTERARGYHHVFDTETQFMRGRNSDGTWVELDELAWSDAYSEGNAWQYTWLVPHDAAGLAELFGGREALFAKLDTFFEKSTLEEDTFLPDNYYWHGNEPDLHAAFLYALLGRPADTWRWSAWIRDGKYNGEPDGLDGNDDGGTLSAWYVLVAMGLYPMNGTVDYVLLPPVFDRIVVHRPDGDLVIEADGTGENLSGVDLDGEPLESAVIQHDDLVGGRHLVFHRSETDVGWGAW